MFSIFLHNKQKKQRVLFVKMPEHTARWLFGVREQKPMVECAWNSICTYKHTACLVLKNGWYFGVIAACYPAAPPAISISTELDVALKRKKQQLQKAHVESTTSRIYSLECIVSNKRKSKFDSVFYWIFTIFHFQWKFMIGLHRQ